MLKNSFVYLSDIDNSIIQSVRYATEENFVGEVIVGYNVDEETKNNREILRNTMKKFGFRHIKCEWCTML